MKKRRRRGETLGSLPAARIELVELGFPGDEPTGAVLLLFISICKCTPSSRCTTTVDGLHCTALHRTAHWIELVWIGSGWKGKGQVHRGRAMTSDGIRQRVWQNGTLGHLGDTDRLPTRATAPK